MCISDPIVDAATEWSVCVLILPLASSTFLSRITFDFQDCLRNECLQQKKREEAKQAEDEKIKFAFL